MSNGPSPFATAARSRPLDNAIQGGTRWLEDGTFDGVIEDLDTSSTEQSGQVATVFRADSGGTHRERLFVRTRDGSSFNWQFRLLLGALLQNAAAQARFTDLLSQGETWRRVLESFRGMRLRVTLEAKPGFRLVPNPEDQTYSAVHTSGEVLATCTTATETERRAKALGHTKSFRVIKRAEAIDADTAALNLQAFNNAATSIEATARASGSTDTQFAGYDGAPPRE